LIAREHQCAQRSVKELPMYRDRRPEILLEGTATLARFETVVVGECVTCDFLVGRPGNQVDQRACIVGAVIDLFTADYTNVPVW
jgi:hypothetical protein